MTLPIHIMRPGTFTPMRGNPVTFTASALKGIARAYDPALRAAPIVIGHPADDGPSLGTVAALTVEEDGLYAHATAVEPGLSAMVQAGRFKKVSASFLPPGAPGNPTPGSFYLKHVGLLGAVPPAVSGLRPVALAAAPAGGVVTFECSARIGAFAACEAALAARHRELDAVEAKLHARALAAGEAVPGLAEFAGQVVEPERIALHSRALAIQRATPGLPYLDAAIAAEREMGGHHA